MRRKGFTLVELLVVIAIIALLMGILMPALARVRQMALRMLCGTRLSGVGKAMLLYAQDNDDDYPRAGGRGSEWSNNGKIEAWDAGSEADAFEGDPPDAPATIGSCFYLLIKYADVTHKQFICGGDIGAEVFKMSDYEPTIPKFEDIDAWDFGTQPGIHSSYSYHTPFRWGTGAECVGVASFPMGTTSIPSSPVCADRNPYLDKNAEGADDGDGGYVDGYRADSGEKAPEWNATTSELSDPDKTMNAAAHQRDGQNVLYNDISVRFQSKPSCGIANDNIYKNWPGCTDLTDEDRQMGELNPGGSGMETGDDGPYSAADAFLVNEHQVTGIPAGQ